MRLVGRTEVGSAMAEQSGGRDRLGEDDADGDEDGACAGSVGDGNFETRAFWIVIATTETDSTFGQIFTDGDFFLKAPAADACKDARFDTRAISAGNDTFFDSAAGSERFFNANFGLGFDPDGRRVTVAAKARDAFADLERFQLHLVQVGDFTALAEAAFHEQPSEGLFRFMGGGKFDFPEISARVEDGDGVDESFGFLVDFGDNTGADVFCQVAIEFPMERDFLAGKKLFLDADDAAVAADQQGLGALADGHAGARKPRGFDLQLQADPVTLSNAFGDHGIDRHVGLQNQAITRGNCGNGEGGVLCRTD